MEQSLSIVLMYQIPIPIPFHARTHLTCCYDLSVQHSRKHLHPCYDDEMGLFDKLVGYYTENLEAENWHNSHKDSTKHLYILERPTQPKADRWITPF